MKIGTINAEDYVGLLNREIIKGSYQTTDKVSVVLAYLLSLQTNSNPIILGTVDGSIDLEVTVDFQDHPTILWAIYSVRDQVGGYVSVLADYDDPMTIKLNLTEQPGEDKGQEVRYDKNYENLTKIEDSWDVVTEVYPVGQVDDHPLNLSALWIEGETCAKDSDASYGYLTLTSDYSYYKGWISEGSTLPTDLTVYRDGVDDSANWVQGSDGRTLRCDIGDYGAGSTYTVDYWHADFLKTSPSGNMSAVSQLYPRHDISDPSDLLRAGQDYLDNYANVQPSYIIQLPMVSPHNLDFDLLQLGSKVRIEDPDISASNPVIIKRIRKPDLHHPERMIIDVNRILPSFYTTRFMRTTADDNLSASSVRLFDTIRGIYSSMKIWGDYVGAFLLSPASDTYEIRHIRIKARRVGSIGPSICVAILSDKDEYYSGLSVLAYRFIGPGDFSEAGAIWTATDWSIDISISSIIDAGGDYYIALHAPYAPDSDNYLEAGTPYYSDDNGQTWSLYSAPGTIPQPAVEIYGVSRNV